MRSLIVTGFVLILLLLSIMLGKKKKLFADKFLILYLSFSAVRQIYTYIEYTGLLEESYWMLLGKGVYLLHAPFFFLYVYALTRPEKLERKYIAMLFLPFILYTLHFFYFYFWVFDRVTLSIDMGLLYLNGKLSISWLIFVILFLIIEPIFLFLFYFLLTGYRKKLLESVSNVDSINLKWLQVIFYLWLLSAIILVPISTFTVGWGWISTDLMAIAMEMVSVIFFFIVGFYGFNQTTVFTNLELKQQLPLKTGNYERSGLSPQQAKELHSKLIRLMEEKKPYLNGALTAGELSHGLGISVNHLSQVLNQEQKQNFFDFVNSYRIKEVMLKIKEPANSHLTLLAMALDSGFNSKTSFNTIFKKITHQTPSQYYKSVKR
jgi:AraC-like DNA-binding protein